MTTVTAHFDAPAALTARASRNPQLRAFATLVRRRFTLTARTPRELVVPVVNPIIFAVVIAPALADIVGRFRNGLDYMSFVAIGTAGLLVPINCLFAGVGVFTDRSSGARRDLLAAPIRRPLVVMSNLAVALATTGLQLAALVGAAILRGARFDTSAGGVLWFVAAAALLAVAMYSVAEILANRMATQEQYVGALPAVAILPYFFAGSLFPISSLPTWLGAVAKFLPLTHALALMRYGVIDPHAYGLHDIWGAGDPTILAARSLGVLVVFGAAFAMLAVRVFGRAASR